MENYIIVAALIVAAVAGVCSVVRHFKGQGGCCGGGSYKPKKKKISKIRYQKSFQIEGMHCDHCKYRVEETINDIDGIAGTVNLKKGELTVSYAEDVSDELIKTKIERVGYTVTGMGIQKL